MDFIRKYKAYIRDNPQGYWFKRKLFGWGWTPARWQGWAVMLVAVGYVLLTALDFSARSVELTQAELLVFFGKVFGTVALLILICYQYGESPKWQWGFPEDTDGKKDS